MYSYDAVGNRLTLQEGTQAAKQYAYGEDNRLLSIVEPAAINEDFEDSVANNWVVASGSWSIVTDTTLSTGQKVYSELSNKAGTYQTWYGSTLSQGTEFSNFTYKAKVRLLAGSAQFLLRSDKTTSITVTLSSTSLGLAGCTSGSSISKNPGTTWHDIRIVASGSIVQVYYDQSDTSTTPDVQASDCTTRQRGYVGLGATSTSADPASTLTISSFSTSILSNTT